MERDSLHLHGNGNGNGIDPSLSLYNIPYSKNPIQPSNISSKGLLKAPPISLIHSAPILLQPPPQPPLLPLPRRSSSCPAIKNVSRKTRNQAFNPKKSAKSYSTKNNITKKEDKRSWDSVTVSSADSSRREQPKNHAEDDLVPFTISPPPSSLPLPTFSLRPKLIRTNAGATDDLRRLLRL